MSQLRNRPGNACLVLAVLLALGVVTHADEQVRLRFFAAAIIANPEQVTDLTNTGQTENTLSFTWSTVGDGIGGAAKYDIRLWVTGVGQWGAPAFSATELTGGTHTFESLASDTAYTAQLVSYRGTLDVDAVFGDLSNMDTGTTDAAAPPPGNPTLLFSTSFTTGEGWTQDATQYGDCGGATDFSGKQTGVANYGGWKANNTLCSEVNTAANHSGGAGGRGFRQPRASGTNNNGGSISIDTADVPVIWFRYYYRFQSGFSFNGGAPHYTKDLYINVQECGGQYTLVGFGDGSFWSQISSANFYSSQSWSAIMGGSTGDGLWHYGEVYINFTTEQIQLWHDGAEVLGLTSVSLQACDLFKRVVVGENQNLVTNGPWVTDFDDIAIVTAGGPIGAYNAGRGF